MQLTERIYQFIATHQLLTKGDVVLVAVSGGPDSIALLHILYTLREQLGISLHGAHLDHMFRGLESQKDAQYVQQFCASLDIPCTAESIDVSSYGKEHRLSNQVAAREVRYHFLNRVAEKYQAQKIALGHHADDQAETILLNLMRGTGVGGLGGIAPLRDHRYVRPLLAVRRKEIEQYCQNHDLNYRIDSSNKKTVYMRNKVRLELLPHLEEHYNPEIVLSLGRLAELSREENQYIEGQASKKFEHLANFNGTDMLELPLGEFNNQPLALRRRLVRMVWQKLIGTAMDLSYHHVQTVLDQCKKLGTGRVELPAGLRCKIAYGKIIFTLNEKPRHSKQPLATCYALPAPGDLLVPELGITIKTQIYNRSQLKENANAMPANQAVFDFTKITDQLSVRTRRPGDRFTPQGAGGTVKLKKFLIDQKVPQGERASIPLICSGDKIIWVSGLRIGEYWKVTAQTETILHIGIQPVANNP